jgi:hypothetical protein
MNRTGWKGNEDKERMRMKEMKRNEKGLNGMKKE